MSMCSGFNNIKGDKKPLKSNKFNKENVFIAYIIYYRFFFNYNIWLFNWISEINTKETRTNSYKYNIVKPIAEELLKIWNPEDYINAILNLQEKYKKIDDCLYEFVSSVFEIKKMLEHEYSDENFCENTILSFEHICGELFDTYLIMILVLEKNNLELNKTLKIKKEIWGL